MQKSAWKEAGRLLRTAWGCLINLGMCYQAGFPASAGPTSGTTEALTQGSEGQMWPPRSWATGWAWYLSLSWGRRRWCPCLWGGGAVLWLRTCVANTRRWADCAVSEIVRKIHRIFTEILQRQGHKLSSCTREEGTRDLYLFKQQMRLPRSGRLGLTGEQLCREGLGVLVGSKPNMSQWLREHSLFSLEKGSLRRFWGEGKPKSSLCTPTGRLSRRWRQALHCVAWWEVKRQQA